MAKIVLKRKEKRKQGENKEIKRTKKAKQEQYGENELWNKLKKLSSSFAKMKEVKKDIRRKASFINNIFVFCF